MFPTRTKIQFFVAFISIVLIAAYGYVAHEDFADTEKVEIEAPLNKQETYSVKNSTTTIPILVYHKIGKPDLLPLPKGHRPARKFSVQSDTFELQMQFILDKGYTPLTVQELVSDEQRGTLPLKPIAITFDDGWRSQYQNAIPVLTKYHIPATFYIYTGVIGSPMYMTWENLHSLVDLHMEIGDHTKSHPRLTKINGSKLDEELVGSKRVLERNLHVSVSDFAYPYGDYNDKIIDAVQHAGYVSARTSNRGLYNTFNNLYKLNVLYAPGDLQTLEEMLKQGA